MNMKEFEAVRKEAESAESGSKEKAALQAKALIADSCMTIARYRRSAIMGGILEEDDVNEFINETIKDMAHDIDCLPDEVFMLGELMGVGMSLAEELKGAMNDGKKTD